MAFERNEAPQGIVRIEGYAGKALVVAGEKRAGAVLVWPEGLEERGAKAATDLTEDMFSPLFALDPPRDVVLIGTGAAMSWPDFDLLAALRRRGIEPEVMDSRAAARTYNLLVSEERNVAALILPLA